MEKWIKVIGIAVTTLALTSHAEARRHYHYQYTQSQSQHRQLDYQQYYFSNQRVVSHPSGCPGRAFCGCGVSVSVFGRPVRDLYLARNWFKFPRSTPAPGMVAVRRHHVMKILAVDASGNATVYDPNSGGHQTRIHTRSLAGYTVVNPHGGNVPWMVQTYRG